MCTENTLCREAVCLHDFCGSAWLKGNVSYWADWCPTNRMVWFGGDWRFIPPLKAETCPADEVWLAHVNRHLVAAGETPLTLN
ncbi:hypothetical protein [Geothermobacter hydrogeniphilus]|uniref:Uncharacterized protein n=1 Tax=Geothermobacter hydrogeniphilus TaxID=1969733 RepID=A0A1X0Y882_9BACT|nr:hypothetical protein [Geothermobacter hydrogeniphilus]ORJ61322.1 hypothetical protein B5V00_06735 [Geothermobacter hydrogeniphilus]